MLWSECVAQNSCVEIITGTVKYLEVGPLRMSRGSANGALPVKLNSLLERPQAS